MHFKIKLSLDVSLGANQNYIPCCLQPYSEKHISFTFPCPVARTRISHKALNCRPFLTFWHHKSLWEKLRLKATGESLDAVPVEIKNKQQISAHFPLKPGARFLSLVRQHYNQLLQRHTGFFLI